MKRIIYQVDAFTSVPFRGNPAGVCILNGPADEAWMTNVALEMNLSETAFLYPVEDDFNLRWFTPAVEVDLCGHATLASAHILWETGCLRRDEEARFRTRSGLLTARRADDWIEMDFPSEPVSHVDELDRLTEILGVRLRFVGRNRMDYLVEVEDEQTVRDFQPDLNLVSRLPARGLIVTSRSQTGGFDFISTFFAPAVGVPEDPVTGSAHCALAPYWSKILGKPEMIGYQASQRGGVVRVRNNGERVMIGGQSVTVMKCELQVE